MNGISIVVPVYNEAESLPRMLEELADVSSELAHRSAIEVVVVDDGSTDASAELVETWIRTERAPHATWRIERHSRNRGIGAALRTGLHAARGAVIVTTDADGSYPMREIPRLLEYMTPDASVVTASPYHPDGASSGVPPGRLLLSRGASLLYRLALGRGVHTYTSLFRAYRRHVVDSVAFASDGPLAVTELLVRAIVAGHRVVEYPTALYGRRLGRSKARLIAATLAHLRFIAVLLLHRMGIADFGVARTSYRTR